MTEQGKTDRCPTCGSDNWTLRGLAKPGARTTHCDDPWHSSPVPAAADTLDELLEKASHHVMTEEEKEAQRQSWARGEMAISEAEKKEGRNTTAFPPLKALDGVQVLVGLRQQGHIPTVEKMLAEGKSWDEIGDAIGWCGKVAKEWYEAESATPPQTPAPRQLGEAGQHLRNTATPVQPQGCDDPDSDAGLATMIYEEALGVWTCTLCETSAANEEELHQHICPGKAAMPIDDFAHDLLHTSLVPTGIPEDRPSRKDVAGASSVDSDHPCDDPSHCHNPMCRMSGACQLPHLRAREWRQANHSLEVLSRAGVTMFAVSADVLDNMLASYTASLRSELDKAQSDVKTLDQWKREAIEVFNGWDKVQEYVRKNGGKLGRSASDEAVRILKEQAATIEQLQKQIKGGCNGL